MTALAPLPTDRAYSQIRSYAERSAAVHSCGSDATTRPSLWSSPAAKGLPRPPLPLPLPRLTPPVLPGGDVQLAASPRCGTLRDRSTCKNKTSCMND